MKRNAVTTGVLAGLMMLAGIAVGQDEAPEQERQERQQRQERQSRRRMEGENKGRPQRFGGRGMQGGMRGGMQGRMAGGPEDGQRGGMQEAILMKLLSNPEAVEAIGLSEEQVTTLKTGFEGGKTETDALREKLEAISIEQAEKMLEKPVDQDAVLLLIDKRYEIMRDMAKLRIKQLLLIQNTLTPEQIEKSREVVREQIRRRIRERLREQGGDRGERGEGGMRGGPERGMRGEGQRDGFRRRGETQDERPMRRRPREDEDDVQL